MPPDTVETARLLVSEPATTNSRNSWEGQVRRYVAEVLKEPRLVGEQRRAVASFLRYPGVSGEAIDSAVLAVSELLSNGVLYGGADAVDLSVAHNPALGTVIITVDDRTPGIRAEPGRPDGDAEGGRGLLLVGVLAEEWGVSRDGCVTWCVIACAPGGERYGRLPDGVQP
ncbi:ATP-binding protein [Streptomyces sp. NPDC059913]|uniref:ATP-binding protein n=1 Tax=Streptomyces sp. NPDC059913 TaxID=3346999 RepID=UPI00364AA4F8